jgi:hypothetical protein
MSTKLKPPAKRPLDIAHGVKYSIKLMQALSGFKYHSFPVRQGYLCKSDHSYICSGLSFLLSWQRCWFADAPRRL